MPEQGVNHRRQPGGFFSSIKRQIIMKTSLLIFVLAFAAVLTALVTLPAARNFAKDVGYGISQAIFGHMHRNGLILGAYSFPEGAQFLFSQTFASAKTVTALTNASPAVATSTAHGYSGGSEILLASGWEDAGDSVYKTGAIDANSFNVTGLNSTDTNWFSAGSGIGSAQLISNWVAIPQVLTIATSGGDPRFTTISPLARRNSMNVPTGFNATSITLTLGHDAANANYQTMLDISRSLKKVAFKMLLSGGATSYGYGYMAVSEIASLNVGQANTVTASFSLLGRSISYS